MFEKLFPLSLVKHLNKEMDNLEDGFLFVVGGAMGANDCIRSLDGFLGFESLCSSGISVFVQVLLDQNLKIFILFLGGGVGIFGFLFDELVMLSDYSI